MSEMPVFATTEDLAKRLPFEMSPEEKREAQGALEDLTQDAIHLGRRSWTPENVPLEVKNVVLRAAARHMKNYEGYTESRAGDESVAWTDRGEESGGAHFTNNERKKLQLLAGNSRSGFWSLGATAWGNSDKPVEKVTQPTDWQGNEVPMFAHEGEPW